MKKYLTLGAVGLAMVAFVAACGGGNKSPAHQAIDAPPAIAWIDTPPIIFNSGDTTPLSTPAPVTSEPVDGKYTISGSVMGYVGSGLILDNNGESLEIAKGAATLQFAFPVAAQSNYEVKVVRQPGLPAQACTVSGGTGVALSTVTSVIVRCATDARFAYLAKLSGSIERFDYDYKFIRFGSSLGETTLDGAQAATNIGMARHPYKSMVYALQTGAGEIRSYLVDEKSGELLASSVKAVPAISDGQDAQINSVGSKLIAHPNGKMLYSFDTTRIYSHVLNDGGQPVATSITDGPAGSKMFEGVLNPAGSGLFINSYLAKEISVFPVDPTTGKVGVPLAPRKLKWPVTRMSFHPEGKTLFTNHESGWVSYKVDSQLGLTQSHAGSGQTMNEVVSDPYGKFMFVVAPSTASANRTTSGFRQFVEIAENAWWPTIYAAPVVNPPFNIAAIDPLGKYVYMFGEGKVLALPTGDALSGATPTAITGITAGRALLLY